MNRRRFVVATLVALLAVGSQLLVPSAASATPPLESGRVAWRVKVALDYYQHTPGIGPDGTIYIPSKFGKTQAVNPDGSTQWIVGAGGDGGTPISVLSDGTVIVAGGGPGAVGGTTAIYALTPSGTIRWSFTATRDYLIAGPSVGPDGNIYAVTDVVGIGFFSLTPAGQLRFSTGQFSEYGASGQRIAFGPDRVYFGFDMYGLAPSTLFAYDFNGSLRWTVRQTADPPAPVAGPNGNVVFGSFPTGVGLSLAANAPSGAKVYSFYEFPGNTQEPADVGIDNVAYTVRNLSTLYALNPNGTVRFRYNDTGIMFEPRIRPQNDLLFMGGRITYGEPGFFRAVTTTGQGLWQVPLPTEPGFGEYGQLVPSSRPVFSPSGERAYAVVDVAGDGNVPYADVYAYLYAIDLRSGSTPPPDATVPAPPTNLTAQAFTGGRIVLRWSDNSTNETQFSIERCSGRKCRDFAEVARVGTDATSYTDTGLVSGIFYRYRVRAIGTAGASAYSDPVRVEAQ